jgi:2-polyprenyl-3-methyl-5-hydroxy-6-metoxy-1,4-benzoquinol methylase
MDKNETKQGNMMSSWLKKELFEKDEETGIWTRKDFESINYSDGDDIEDRLLAIVRQAGDVSLYSEELESHCTDWPSRYHFSHVRANLLYPLKQEIKGEVLEIGAGCGAITRFLGECNTEVTAVEGSYRRAKIARSRTRDLNNVNVVACAFEDFSTEAKFDVVTLVGVLEYASLFTSGKQPALAMLAKAQAMLKPDGMLIIAIENQLGLKYFAGAYEDHAWKQMYGIEDKYTDKGPRTFGKLELSEMLGKAGYLDISYYYPFPDYKMPLVTITDKGFDCKEFDSAALVSPASESDENLPGYTAFSQNMTWPVIIKNGLAKDLSNSFLICARKAVDAGKKSDDLAYYFGSNKLPRYKKFITFKSDINSVNSHISVQNQHLSGHHILLESDILDYKPEILNRYVSGKSLQSKYYKIFGRNEWSLGDVAQITKIYSDYLSGFERLENGYLILPSHFYDATPANLIEDEKGTIHFIDQDLIYKGTLTKKYVMFRGILWMIASFKVFGRCIEENKISRLKFVFAQLESVNLIVSNEDLMQIFEIERKVSKQIKNVDLVVEEAWLNGSFHNNNALARNTDLELCLDAYMHSLSIENQSEEEQDIMNQQDANISEPEEESATHKYQYEVELGANTAPAKVIEMIGSGHNIFEIGSGPGSITRKLAEGNKNNVSVFEIDEQAIKIVTKYCDQVYSGDLNETGWSAKILPQQFDVVLAADVLEHLNSPLDVLTEMTSLLVEGGSVVISVPHVGHASLLACIYREDFEYKDWGLLDKTHIRFFGINDIQRLVNRSGLIVTDIDYVCKHPLETEFAQHWEQLPFQAKQVFSSSPFSSVYQVVFKARKRTNETEVGLSFAEYPVPLLLAKEYEASPAPTLLARIKSKFM